MKKATFVLIAALLLLSPAAVLAKGVLTFRLGYFVPTMKDYNGTRDTLWAIEFDQMSFRKQDFRQGMLGVSYELPVLPQLSIALSVDTYNKQKIGFYTAWGGYSFDEGDFAFPYPEFNDPEFDINHVFAATIVPIQLSAKLTPFGRRLPVVPYVGGGVGLYIWSARITGETVDFSDPWVYTDDLGSVDIYPVRPTGVRQTSATLGYQAFGGLEVPIGYRLALHAEFRYMWARGKMTGDFQDFDDFDAGGYWIGGGFNYSF